MLSTDEVRKDLTGTPRDQHRFAPPGGGIYDSATTDVAYAEQLRKAELLTTRGQSVVLDGSWTHERHRSAVRRLAARSAAELVEIECVLDSQLAKERITRRLCDPWNPSDATPEVVDHLADLREPWPSAVQLDTAVPVEDTLARAVVEIDRHRQA